MSQAELNAVIGSGLSLPGAIPRRPTATCIKFTVQTAHLGSSSKGQKTIFFSAFNRSRVGHLLSPAQAILYLLRCLSGSENGLSHRKPARLESAAASPVVMVLEMVPRHIHSPYLKEEREILRVSSFHKGNSSYICQSCYTYSHSLLFCYKSRYILESQNTNQSKRLTGIHHRGEVKSHRDG